MELKKREHVTDPKQLRVLIVTPSYHVIDGVTLTIRKIKKELEALGGTMMVATAEAARIPLNNDPGVMYFPSLTLPYDSFDNYSVPRFLTESMKREILAFKPNVIHITAPDILCFSIARWARQEKLQLMATWHSNIPDYLNSYGFIQRVILKNILIYIFQTNYSYCPWTFVPQPKLLERMKREGYENPHTGNKLRIWGRGVDTDHFNPAKRSREFRASHGVNEQEVVVMWVGRCVTEKFPEIFTEVLQRLTEKYPNKIKGWVVGRGEHYEIMTAVKNVTGMGWRSRDELADLYANADILLFPSTVETFGNVTLEAMSSGTACIVDKTCSSHLVEHEKIGYCCESVEEYIVFTEKLVQDTATRKAMGIAARAKAEAQYKVRDVLRQLINYYVEVANLTDEDLAPVKPQLRHYISLFLYKFVDSGGFFLVQLLGYFAFYGKSTSSQFLIVFIVVAAISILWYLFSFASETLFGR
mmetsp:Transcript_4979/g.6474  ORF Transcript_4979/g.6474 Transcript_4979/m.6474 type:complete len:472 (-) Transcript_4979:176-1591(-)|eukprot:CAMPEP_0204871418 /NCGR_PEP_ID=MMETSP1348-20121228/35333_1 /ASSEMBLY_ACC=CAM_ASM_000700 /TAXON_ID=215587 /ORGANISM="Aplanochytrium stocchinoi, Strain GSBS06" /LENGTH=471 /DNA_ID=CAMNT_0052025693 /DNA_START=151 /DNA_END=1566 /DNA_ORIENTATION=+